MFFVVCCTNKFNYIEDFKKHPQHELKHFCDFNIVDVAQNDLLRFTVHVLQAEPKPPIPKRYVDSRGIYNVIPQRIITLEQTMTFELSKL